MELLERLVTVENKAHAAHQRMDNFEESAREDLAEIKDDIKEIAKDMKEVVAWKNRTLGWAAAALFLTSVVSGSVAWSVAKFMVRAAAVVEKPSAPRVEATPDDDEE